MALPHWALLDFIYAWLGDRFNLNAATFEVVHLKARYTMVEPQLHIVPRMRRGVALLDDLYPCFVAYKEVEQDELGDTLDHTFNFSFMAQGTTFWVYFVGEVAGIASPSTSPWFKVTVPVRTHPGGWPYLGFWDKWPAFITNPQAGILYLCIRDETGGKSICYHSEDFGLNWAVYTHSLMTGFPMTQVAPTSTGNLAISKPQSIMKHSTGVAIWGDVSPYPQAGEFANIFVDPAEPSQVWVSCNRFQTFQYHAVAFSDNGGLHWDWGTSQAAQGSGRIWVDRGLSRGICCFTGSGGWQIPMKATHFWYLDQDWSPWDVPARGWRFGMYRGRVVTPLQTDTLTGYHSNDSFDHYQPFTGHPGMRGHSYGFCDIAAYYGRTWFHDPECDDPGIYFSPDHCATWEKVSPAFGSISQEIGIVFDVHTTNTLYAWGSNGGFRVSTDDGHTWQLRNKGLEAQQW
jgi:hypothetical protein